ncbi:MAG: hypothetical protein EXR50_05665 [Dehalococcoidia bacterium]|nr:hypothetical protein [Dehalococcoidia bacterium]
MNLSLQMLRLIRHRERAHNPRPPKTRDFAMLLELEWSEINHELDGLANKGFIELTRSEDQDWTVTNLTTEGLYYLDRTRGL